MSAPAQSSESLTRACPKQLQACTTLVFTGATAEHKMLNLYCRSYLDLAGNNVTSPLCDRFTPIYKAAVRPNDIHMYIGCERVAIAFAS